ncbi:MAG: ABC transporter ATP-binding protein, partial [Lutispora sp.]|nr:ABC transporter ATP-binding protein [Lutispora sp.]
MMPYAIECINISKNYGKTNALSDVNMKIQKDKIYGLLGRNGAGKSTLLNIISAQVFPSDGAVKVFGEAPYENEKALKNLCMVKESGMFLKDVKVEDALSIASYFYPNWDKNLAKRLLDDFELDEKKEYKNLSLGMKSQLGIITGLSSRAPLTIFDEPYIGLDAAGRQLFYDVLIEDYMENPRTIILSTHLIDEVSNLLEEIIILHKGSVKLEGNSDDIKKKAFYIIGMKDQVEKHISNKKVLHREEFGKNLAAVTFDEISDNEINAMKAEDL